MVYSCRSKSWEMEERMSAAAFAELEDDDFLSQVAAVEADALSAKRRKITSTTTKTAATTSTTPNSSAEEGAYISVLKGSKSHLFRQQSTSSNITRSGSIAFANKSAEISAGVGGSCFKCGKPGHWSRDCVESNSYSVDSSVPEKDCPCGLGVCLVRTARTEKNSGRKFYKCPQENGGCGFFEWCDQKSGNDNTIIRSENHIVNPSVPEISCPCGAGACLTLTAKTGNNIGQLFYRCPSSQGGCGFFKWCVDHTVGAGLSDSHNISKVNRNTVEVGKNHGFTSQPCFKCGKDGHWARDCSQTSFKSPVNSGGKNTSNTCFKCGKPGHWAKDCLEKV